MDFLRSLFCKKTEPIKDISDKEQNLLENKDKNTVDVVKQNPINENEEIALLSEEVDATKKAQEEAEAAKKEQEEVDAVKKAQEEAEEAKKAQEEVDAAKKAQEEAEEAKKASEEADEAKKAQEEENVN